MHLLINYNFFKHFNIDSFLILIKTQRIWFLILIDYSIDRTFVTD